jgi:hypothetical protein
MRNSKLITIVIFIFLALILIGIAISIPKSLQTKVIGIAAPYAGSAWRQDAERLHEQLTKHNIQSKLIEMPGGINTAKPVSDPKSGIDVAQLHSFFLSEGQHANLYSLGVLGYAPLWIFYNEKLVGNPSSLQDIAKQKVIIGPKDSGSYAMLKKMFALNGVNIEDNPNFISVPFDKGREEFKTGKAGAAIFGAPFYDPQVIQFFNAGFKLFGVPNAQHYKTKSDFIELTLPAGSMDINGSMPAKDTKLLATTTALVVKRDLHPSLQLALLMTAAELIKENPYKYNGMVIKFPAPIEDSSLETSPVAKKYYADGPPLLIKLFPALLPYWPF